MKVSSVSKISRIATKSKHSKNCKCNLCKVKAFVNQKNLVADSKGIYINVSA
jgi:hypothetical protein